MINHIDVSSVLRRTVCDLYSNLVTRPTGAAVRTEIENLLAAWRGPSLTVDANWERFLQVWRPLLQLLRKGGASTTDGYCFHWPARPRPK